MNKNITEEELLLRKRARRRLVGAIVLVLISIIVLPVIFDEPKPDTEKQEIAINLPAGNINRNRDSLPLPKEELISQDLQDADDQSELQNKSRVSALSNDDMSESAGHQKRIPIPGIKPKFSRHSVAVPAPAKNINPPVAAANSPTAVPVSIAATPVVNTPPPAVTAVEAIAADTAKGFVVQLGAYSDQVKAKQQQMQLVSNGFKVFTETLNVNGNEVTRVRVGPFPSRSTAEAEIKKLKKLGFDGVVVPR